MQAITGALHVLAPFKHAIHDVPKTVYPSLQLLATGPAAQVA